MDKKWFPLPIFLIFFSFSSCFFKPKQKIKVENFALVHTTKLLDSAGVKFSYDIKFRRYIKRYASYQLNYQLVSNSKTVYKSQENTIIKFIKAENIWDSTYRNNLFVIPFADIELDKGKHDVELVITAVGDNFIEAPIFRKPLKIDIPELYDYKEQKLTITNHSIFNKNEVIKLYYNFNFSFKNYQIKGIVNDNSLEYYFLKVIFIDKESNKPIHLASEQFDYEKIKAEKTYNNACSYRIPYNLLKLKPGKYDLKYKLVLTNKKDRNFSQWHEGELSVVIPQYYNATLNIKSLELNHKRKYDPTSVVGQIFGRKKKKRGLGYPDPYWEVYADKDKKYRSVTIDNAFACYPAEVGFIIKDKQRLTLSVWDEDGLTDRDYIGQMTIPNKNGEFKVSYEKKYFGNVKCSFSFGKTKYEPWKD